MVWTMSTSVTFGQFFPSGDFIGWDDTLQKHFEEVMLPEQRALFNDRHSSYALYVSQKFEYECGRTYFPEFPILTPIENHEAPKIFKVERRYILLGSLMFVGGCLVVDEVLKDIIETFDPGVHQYFPISIVAPNGEAYPRSYFILVIRRYLESFLREKSSSDAWRLDYGPDGYSDGPYFINDTYKKDVQGLSFSKVAIGNAGLWRERHNGSGTLLFSDDLEAEAVKAGLRLPKHFRANEL
jgi:hypothetical protein